MLIDKRAFSKISPEDRAIVREVMEGIYRKFDQNGVTDTREAFQALLDSGLKLVPTDSDEVSQWREIVTESHRKLAGEGVFDIALLEQMQGLLDDYRAGQSSDALVAH